ncbi:26S proteasome complex ubiquitin receptor, subunit Rpn13 [Rhodotorula toruloides]|uniref:26S proteasome complex ubiquitin receptor, subunit Rpn13 n=1 Tax=Rhodotorula toruloides TaxID=5286 RepID=A0A511KNM2_RHOTO|nr:26S proteasome complex ubiquitin receptor, subunit Rpn13 [Rhodotorula toruloides]
MYPSLRLPPYYALPLPCCCRDTGLLSLVYLQNEDGLLHFYYKDLTSGVVAEDLIIFPGDATFVKATDRVHVLKFSSSSARHFFWHQDAELSTDEFERRGRQVNELIGADDVEGGAAMEVEADMTGGDATMSDARAPSSAPAPARSAPSADAPGAPRAGAQSVDQMAQLQNILASLGGGAGGIPEFTLPDVLPPSAASSLIASLPDSSLAHLASFLPPHPSLATSTPAETRSSLLRSVSSPEFRRALAALDRALRTGATGPLVHGLGLEARAANGTEEFLEEVQKQADEQKRREGGGGSA